MAIIGQAPGFLADGLGLLAIPMLVLSTTHSALLSSLAAAPRAIGYLLAGVPGGMLVDRSDPGRIMVWSNAVRSALYLALAIAALDSAPPPIAIFAVAFLSAMGSVFFETSLAVFLQQRTPAERVPKAFAQIELLAQGSLVVGPGVVGLLATMTPTESLLWLMAGSYAVAFFTSLVSASSGRSAVASAIPTDSKPAGGTGFRVILAHRGLLTIAMVQVLVSFLMAAETTLVYFLLDVVRVPPLDLGLIVSSVGIGGISGAAVTMLIHSRLRHDRLLFIGVGVVAVGFAMLALTRETPLLMLGNGLIGLGSILSAICIRTLRQRWAPPGQLGRVTGTSRTFALAATPIGGMVLGGIIQLTRVDPAVLFGISAFLLLAVGVASSRPLRLALKEKSGSVGRLETVA